MSPVAAEWMLMRLTWGVLLAIGLGVVIPGYLVVTYNASVRHKLASPGAVVVPPLPEPPQEPRQAAVKAAEPPEPEAELLKAARAAPVQVLGQVSQPDARSWRVDLEIQNRGGDFEQGFVWAVATVRTADGRLVRVPSDRKIDVKHPARMANGEHGQWYKARRFTNKTVAFALPSSIADATLEGVEVFVSTGRGHVSKFTQVAH